ncbi:MAG: TfoX/Sxy family protein [Alphaproteobacteria bacterium]
MATKTPPFAARIVARLAPLGPVYARAMFGAYGVYLDDLMFGLIAWDRVYFRVDDATKKRFAAGGGEAFAYDRAGQTVTMSYWEPPKAALRSAAGLVPWAELGLAAARRARAAKNVKVRTRVRTSVRTGARGTAPGNAHGKAKPRRPT